MSEYTVITSTGRVLLFSIKSCADMYQKAYGGVVFTSQVLDNSDQCDILASIDNKRIDDVYTA